MRIYLANNKKDNKDLTIINKNIIQIKTLMLYIIAYIDVYEKIHKWIK